MANEKEDAAGPIGGRVASVNPAVVKERGDGGGARNADDPSPGAAGDEAQAKKKSG